jgi:hypothetical protein
MKGLRNSFQQAEERLKERERQLELAQAENLTLKLKVEYYCKHSTPAPHCGWHKPGKCLLFVYGAQFTLVISDHRIHHPHPERVP